MPFITATSDQKSTILGSPQGVILGVVWGSFRWPKNEYFRDHFWITLFFLKTQHFQFSCFYIKFKNRILISALQSEHIFGKHKTLSLFVIFVKRKLSPFLRRTHEPKSVFYWFFVIFRGKVNILPSVLPVTNLTFSKKLEVWAQNNDFCSCTYRGCFCEASMDNNQVSLKRFRLSKTG